jgi:lipopolysaccharide/colanic/teichoic acid biosynthesis glycosyltransferase
MLSCHSLGLRNNGKVADSNPAYYPDWLQRSLDLVLTVPALVLLSPFLLLIACWIVATSRGGAFYTQSRIGRHGVPFQLFKFRSMRPASDQQGLLTVGDRDPRITPVGVFLRRYKIDELPQLWNVVLGDMSIVGPRPEVEKYVKTYSETQRKVLLVRPGLTDWASMYYLDEDAILAQREDPEKAYIDEILPAKLDLSLQYIQHKSLPTDLKVIFQTILAILRRPLPPKPSA